MTRRPLHPPSPRGGNALLAALFWVIGGILFVTPFLRDQTTAWPEGEDPGRLVSEVDIPFHEDVAVFEEDMELELGGPIAEASAKWFSMDDKSLREGDILRVERLEAGGRAYARHCAGCHGANGNGAGPAARFLEPRPRNFRRGLFKFTSTATGSPPRRRDIFQTITRGLSGSSMPDFRLLSEEIRWDLAEYVRYLAIKGSFEQLMLDIAWEDEEVPDGDDVASIVLGRWTASAQRAIYPPTQEPQLTEETIAHGREVYLATDGGNCQACHGPAGKGDGTSADAFLDDWGYPIQPRDLTQGVFRAGSEGADLYRTIATGITGTPMPSYGGSMPSEDIWAMVHFVMSLREDT